MTDLQERERTPERKVFGEYKTIELPVVSFVRLPQVRSGLNPSLPELKQSIEARGLLNQIDVARMSEEQLEVYINFVNRTWKTDVTIADYSLQQQADGYYYVVVAGHTRTEAVYQLQQESDSGAEYAMVAKVHPISTPQEIIGLQLDENIHTKPAQEQRAIAIVESYTYGLENGDWADKADFLKQSKGKFSRQILNEAMGFAQLPLEARDLVFSGRLSYNAGVALGQATDTVLEYVVTRLGYTDEISAKEKAKIEKMYRQEFSILTGEITSRKLNGTAAKKFIIGRIGLKRDRINKTKGLEDDDDGLFSMATFEEDTAAYEKEVRQELAVLLREIAQQPVDQIDHTVHLLRKLAGFGEEDPDRIDELEQRRQAIAKGVLVVCNNDMEIAYA